MTHTIAKGMTSTMSIEKKYTDEKIKAMADEAIRKAKELAAAGFGSDEQISKEKSGETKGRCNQGKKAVPSFFGRVCID